VIRRSDGLATFMSVFPEGYGDGLDGLPIGGMEYVAPTDNGDLLYSGHASVKGEKISFQSVRSAAWPGVR
jgi:hypothetical protein